MGCARKTVRSARSIPNEDSFHRRAVPISPGHRLPKLISHWLDAACRKHGVDLIAIDERGGTARAIPELPGVCSELLPVSVGKSIVARLTRLVASFGRGIPATSLVYMPGDVEQRVRKHVGAQSYDAAVLTENDVAGFATLLAPSVPLFYSSIPFKRPTHVMHACATAWGRRAGCWPNGSCAVLDLEGAESIASRVSRESQSHQRTAL